MLTIEISCLVKEIVRGMQQNFLEMMISAFCILFQYSATLYIFCSSQICSGVDSKLPSAQCGACLVGDKNILSSTQRLHAARI